MGFTKVKVVPIPECTGRFRVSWPAQSGAVKYIVYVSPSPANRNKFKEIPKHQLSTEFQPPIFVPNDAIFFFWVSFISPSGREIFVQDQPSFTLIDGEFSKINRISPNIARDIATDKDMRYYLEEIRRRHLFMNQNDGEDFLLHIERVQGQPSIRITENPGQTGRVVPVSQTLLTNIMDDFDPDTPSPSEEVEAKDPGYQEIYRDKGSLGTGIVGGYFPAIRIRVRYGELPQRIINFVEQGISYEHDFNSWTIWHPRLKENDVLIRARDNERFLVKQIASSEVAGIFLHQRFKSVSEPRSSMIYKISDQTIREALESEGGFDVARWNWSIWF